MKSIKKEIKSYQTMYVANDGTEFSSEEECRNYERTALCALGAIYRRMVVKSTDEFSLSGFGSEDNDVELVRVKSESDIKTIMQLVVSIMTWLDPYKADNEDEKKRREERLNSYTEKCYKAMTENTLLVVFRGYCKDENFCIEGTINDMIHALELQQQTLLGVEKAEEEK